MAFPSISEEELTPDLYFTEDSNKEEISLTVPHMQEKENGKGPEEELREEQAGAKGPLEDATGPSAACGESSEQPKARSSRRTMNYTDRVRVLNLRRNLNQLDGLAKEKEMMIQKNREELNGCHFRMDLLTAQQRRVEEEIESEKEAGNTAAVFRLQAMHRRLCDELANEKDLESRIAAVLNENMLEIWKIEIEQGNFSELRKQIRRDEEELDQRRQEQAEERLQKQEDRKRLLSRRWLTTEQKIKQGSKAYEDSLPQALEDAHQNHRKAVQFLKNSLRRVREKEASEELKLQEYMQRRMDTVLSLKNNIAAKRENLQTLQACDKASALLSQEQDRKMEEALQAKGCNATRAIFLQKRQAEFERQKKEFMEQQKARKIEIVSRILKENAQLEKARRESRPRMPKGRRKLSDASRWRMKTWRYIQEACGDSAATVTQKTWRSPSPCDLLEDKCYFLEGSQWTMPEIKDEDEEEDGSETLAEPEFTGIWDQECRISEVSDDRKDSKPVGATKLEKEIFAQNLEKLHSGVIRKHRVCGREFKGCPFYSKPSLVHFKDFDVGKTYKKKMVLINAFYSINYCKLVGVSEHLKDFFTVHFDPPGPMSAGMSCEVGVTFKPMINEDLEGEITFLSQIGSFSVPLKCSTKKCVLALDKELIDFGTHVVGETISRTITLTNSGALGTRFQLCRSGSSDVAHAEMLLPSAEKMVCPPVLGISSAEKSSINSQRDSVVDKETVSPSRSEEVIQHSNLMPEKLRSDVTASVIQLEHFCHAASTVDITRGSPLPSLVMSSLECLWKEEIVAGKVTEGDIAPFSSVKLQINFTPAIPGDVQADFKIVFDNPDCKPLCFSATAVSMAVPVWVPNPDVDLKICMYDRLYQDCIVIHSRATSALRLKFDVCKELANHMELLPKTGYIQAQSCFSVQLKFLPRHSLPEDAAKYFDEKTGVLEVPMLITVSDQSKPVEFTVHAIITTSDLEISPAELDFGYCSVYEAVRTKITITNKAMLPQEFGFVGPPAFVEIQPNDGFGILLPLESLDLDVIFKAKEAKEYSFQLTCKTEINRQFKLSCKAVGVHPPLQLSHSLVQFSATALNDVSTATLFVINSHVSLSQFNHAGPRIGSGEVAPVGPTSFQFLVPEDAPITIMPCVGTVLPGKKCLIEVSFRPVLCDQLIRLEAVNLLCQAAESKALVEKKARELELQRKKEEAMAGRKDGKKLASISFLGQLSKDKHGNKLFEPPSPEDICPDSEEYIAAHLSLVRSFSGRFDKYVIPCFVASGDIDEKKGAENLQYSPYNTLYLELHCPAVAPAVVVVSNNGKTVFNFGDVAIGHRIKKEVKIQNITQEQLTLGFSLLNPFGPFLLVNPIRTLREESCNLIISFCPEEKKWFFETLEIKSEKATLTLTLIGQGVIPSITCSIEGDVFNMGYVVAKEMATATFKIENTSPLPLTFTIHLESLSPNRDQEQQALPPFLTSRRKTNLVGTQNYSGLSVFSVTPMEGTIGLGKAQEFTVTFSPDHESLYYSDCIRVLLFGKEVIRVIQLKGAARNHMMFVEGGEPLDVSIESLAVTTSLSEELAKAESDKSTSSILLSLESVQSETLVIPAVRELKIGGIRTSQFASKKNVEFSWEGLQLLQLKGFTVDPVKGNVDRGQTKAVTVSWVPPAGSDLNQPVTGSATLVVRGDVKEIYSVYCVGRIVTKAAPADSKCPVAAASPDR